MIILMPGRGTKDKSKEDDRKKAVRPKWYKAMLSLVLTPFIIFIATSIELYAINHEEINNKASVLLPFVGLFCIALIIGCSLYYFQEKGKSVKFLLYMYYSLGPIFLLHTLVPATLVGDLVRVTALLGALLLFAWYLYEKIGINRVVTVFSWIALALIIGQAATSANTLGLIGSGSSDNSSASAKVSESGSARENLPNVYHILLDEYQTEMFELTLDDNVKEQLGGFVYYPKNTTVFGRTGMSLPSIFTGKTYDYQEPQIEYQQKAFDSDRSFLYWLKDVGYETQAYIHKIYTFDQPLFDTVTLHSENAQTGLSDQVYTKLFAKLWIYANAPKTVAEKVVHPEFLQQVKAQNILPDEAPVLSSASFKNIIQDDAALDKSGTYTFVHLILPHFPHVLKSDCSYNKDAESSPIEQSQCATKLIGEFTDKLKKLDRYENSLVIIESDHGAKFNVENGELKSIKSGQYSEEWSTARSRALLLIKTPDRTSQDTFMRSEAETTLLDIAPTIIGALGIEAKTNFEGTSLESSDANPGERVRYYHFFDKKGKNEQTDELQRFVIKNGEAQFDRVIPIGGN